MLFLPLFLCPSGHSPSPPVCMAPESQGGSKGERRSLQLAPEDKLLLQLAVSEILSVSVNKMGR